MCHLSHNRYFQYFSCYKIRGLPSNICTKVILPTAAIINCKLLPNYPIQAKAININFGNISHPQQSNSYSDGFPSTRNLHSTLFFCTIHGPLKRFIRKFSNMLVIFYVFFLCYFRCICVYSCNNVLVPEQPQCRSGRRHANVSNTGGRCRVINLSRRLVFKTTLLCIQKENWSFRNIIKKID